MSTAQKPIELILARNLLASISTPAFLVDDEGTLIFYNEAAGALLGKRFEESGKMAAEEWTGMFGPLDEGGQPVPYELLPVTGALRAGRAVHASMSVRSATGDEHAVELSALPLVGSSGGFRGAIAIFWPITSENGS